mmetsp:Transcript_135797/g.307217  ORF Transcript_135797/g.307217 Transcript_135797/m.307217 type:complete len:204 (+) Transcript_135797:662-1273(+)
MGSQSVSVASSSSTSLRRASYSAGMACLSTSSSTLVTGISRPPCANFSPRNSLFLALLLSHDRYRPSPVRHIGHLGSDPSAWSRVRCTQLRHSTCPHDRVVGAQNSCVHSGQFRCSSTGARSCLETRGGAGAVGDREGRPAARAAARRPNGVSESAAQSASATVRPKLVGTSDPNEAITAFSNSCFTSSPHSKAIAKAQAAPA